MNRTTGPTRTPDDLLIITGGLAFPEGPIMMEDGSVVVVEIADGCLTRVAPDDTKEVIARTGGGPNGLATGPDGAIYICNNGGLSWHESEHGLLPERFVEFGSHKLARIERFDPKTGGLEILYPVSPGAPMNGPNARILAVTKWQGFMEKNSFLVRALYQ
jgi:gluconolactonase